MTCPTLAPPWPRPGRLRRPVPPLEGKGRDVWTENFLAGGAWCGRILLSVPSHGEALGRRLMRRRGRMSGKPGQSPDRRQAAGGYRSGPGTPFVGAPARGRLGGAQAPPERSAHPRAPQHRGTRQQRCLPGADDKTPVRSARASPKRYSVYNNSGPGPALRPLPTLGSSPRETNFAAPARGGGAVCVRVRVRPPAPAPALTRPPAGTGRPAGPLQVRRGGRLGRGA